MTASRRAWAGKVPAGSSRLGGWADGYTADVVYLDQVDVDITPVWLSMIAAVNGQPPLEPARPLTWLDLGCGPGLGACTVAAGNPNVDVWGIDYNPAHIERARHLAEAAGLDRCHFVEASFERCATDPSIGPAQVDVVVVNGVYSWISAANRAAIVATIGQRLRPGGLAFVMYEAATGWSSMPPLAEALRLYADADDRPGDRSFHDAAAAVLDLRSNGAHFFPVGPREAGQMDSWRTSDARYGAHEYLGGHFSPLMVSDVVESMATAKCELLGSIGALDHHPYYSTPPDFADLLAGATNPVTRELVRDLVMQRPLRRDLFRRGVALASAEDRQARVRSITIGGTGRPFTDDPVDLPPMPVTLDPAYHEPLVAALAEADLDVDAILGIHQDWAFADAATAIGLLVAGGYATPVVSGGPNDDAVSACERLNRVLAEERSRGAAHACLADPASGAMIEVDLVEALAFDGIRDGVPAQVSPLADLVEATLARHERVVRQDGELVRDPDASRTIVEQRVAKLLDRLPTLTRRRII